MNMKILLIDIETAPIEAYVWEIYNVNVSLNQIKKDWHLLSFAAKWLGKPDVIYFDQSKCRNMENDVSLLRQIRGLLHKADIVIAQNGDRFDVPKIKTRMLVQGIPPPSPFRTIDTLLIARKVFGFTSNKLEHLSKKLHCKVRKDPHPEFQGQDLWTECLKRNPRAWKVMRRYNINDVLSLEDVYLKMRPWIPNHPNLGVMKEGGVHVCPKCLGKVEKSGIRLTQVNRYQRYHCLKCGGWSQDRLAGHFDKEQRAKQLGN